MSHAKYYEYGIKAPGANFNSYLVTIGRESEESDEDLSDECDQEIVKSILFDDLHISPKKLPNSQPAINERSQPLKKVQFSTQPGCIAESLHVLITPRIFSTHLPQWGGNISVKNRILIMLCLKN